MTPIILASASASRARLLRAAGAPFGVVVSGVDEDEVKRRMCDAGPARVAEALADLKALAVSRENEGLVIGADQTLELDGRLYGKTCRLAETRARLELLRGRTHRLHTATAVAQEGEILWRTCATARLTMRRFSEAFLDSYLVFCGEAVASSVGGYQFEGLGTQLFEAVEGDFFSILGLPLMELLGFLRQEGGLPL